MPAASQPCTCSASVTQVLPAAPDDVLAGPQDGTQLPSAQPLAHRSPRPPQIAPASSVSWNQDGFMDCSLPPTGENTR